jgi:tRNA-specific 2-thiouridylase
VLGNFDELQKQEMRVRDVNLMKYASLQKPLETVTRIRYKDKGTPATLNPDGDSLRVLFHAPVAAVTPGQSAVFYEGEDVVGGGFIAPAVLHEPT